MKIEDISSNLQILQVWDSMFVYNLNNWIALNSENYKKYTLLDALTDKIDMLEGILTGNILSFAKGMKINLENEIVCKIISLKEPRLHIIKGVKMMTFNIEFQTNISLLEYIGLGKHVSIGFGTVVKKRK